MSEGILEATVRRVQGDQARVLLLVSYGVDPGQTLGMTKPFSTRAGPMQLYTASHCFQLLDYSWCERFPTVPTEGLTAPDALA